MNLAHVENEAACNSNGGWGWYYSPNNSAPEAIVLCPSICDVVQKSEKAKIQVVLGCATMMSEP